MINYFITILCHLSFLSINTAHETLFSVYLYTRYYGKIFIYLFHHYYTLLTVECERNPVLISYKVQTKFLCTYRQPALIIYNVTGNSHIMDNG